MVMECLAITAIVIAMVVIYLRAKRQNYAVAILPLALVPMIHILGILLSKGVGDLIGARPGVVSIGFDLFGIIISCVLYGLCSRYFMSKKARWFYLILCGIFSLVLGMVLIVNTLSIISK